MFWRSSPALPAHPPGAHGASRAPHLCVSLVAYSASDFAGSAYVFLIMCMSSIPASVLWAASKDTSPKVRKSAQAPKFTHVHGNAVPSQVGFYPNSVEVGKGVLPRMPARISTADDAEPLLHERQGMGLLRWRTRLRECQQMVLQGP